MVSNRRRKNISIKIENLFGETYFTNTSQKFLKVIERRTRFETFIFQCKPLNDIFLQSLSCPNTELRTLLRLYLITNRDDYVEIIILNGLV